MGKIPQSGRLSRLAMNKPLEEMGKFKTVVVDPPWPLKRVGWSKDNTNGLEEYVPYKRLDLDGIRALPVSDCLADDSLLFVWCTNQTLSDAISLVNTWGSRYWFTMTWVKNGGIQLPNGPMFNTEWCIVGRRGSPKFLDIKAFTTANFWKRGAHSEKPEGFYDLLRRVTPSPRIDIFGRRLIPGFVSWGDEAPEGEDLNSNYQDVFDLN